MVATLVKKWDPALDYLSGGGFHDDTLFGHGGYIREIVVTMTGVTSCAFLAADFNFSYVQNALAPVGNMASNTGYFITSLTSAGFTLNAPEDSVVKVFAIGISL